MAGFKVEAQFTEAEYSRFVAAVKKRENYEFQYGDHKTKMRVVISGRQWDNGVWLPENYLWAIDTQDNRGGFNGIGSPFRIDEMKSYDAIIDFIYDAFKLEHPTSRQLSFFEINKEAFK